MSGSGVDDDGGSGGKSGDVEEVHFAAPPAAAGGGGDGGGGGDHHSHTALVPAGDVSSDAPVTLGGGGTFRFEAGGSGHTSNTPGYQAVSVRTPLSVVVPGSGSASTPAPPPPDRYHLIYACFLLLGCGFLLPYNATITAVDYLRFAYPDAPVEFILAVVYTACNLMTVSVNLWVGLDRNSPFAKMWCGFAVLFIVLMVTPEVCACVLSSTHRAVVANPDILASRFIDQKSRPILYLIRCSECW